MRSEIEIQAQYYALTTELWTLVDSNRADLLSEHLTKIDMLAWVLTTPEATTSPLTTQSGAVDVIAPANDSEPLVTPSKAAEDSLRLASRIKDAVGAALSLPAASVAATLNHTTPTPPEPNDTMPITIPALREIYGLR